MALVLSPGLVKPAQSIAPPPVSDQQVTLIAERARAYMQRVLPDPDVRRLYYAGQKIPDLRERVLYYAHVVQQIERVLHERPLDRRMSEVLQWKRTPVDVETFVCDPYYLDKRQEIYPKVLEYLVEINSGKYVEVVFTGGIGSAKTTSALYTCAYQLYLLSCMHNPHRVYGQDSAAELLFIFQSINAKLSKGVDFNRFKSMIEGSQYFKEHFPFKRDVESRLVFPNRIEVVPVSGSETAAIGQNVIGGLIDELNYMAVVEKSKQSVDSGTYDQAVALYNSIARRRKSRFMTQGKLPGILCLVSSKRYPGQFTDQKEEEAKTDPTIYIYDKRVWDIKPAGTFAQEGWFEVFSGDETQKPRIIEPHETPNDDERPKIIKIPLEFIGEFRKDIVNALREIAGVSTLARHPYFLETARVFKSMNRHHSIFSEQEVDFVTTKLSIRPAAIFKPELPRFVHVDLAISGDAAGVAVGTVKGFRSMKALGMSENDHEMMPEFHIDGVLRVKPPRNAEIQFWKIREAIVKLRDLGMNIRWVTFDSFQSVDSQQLLRQQAFITGLQSMDVTPCWPYDYLKSAVYDGRVAMPEHVVLRREILSLERDLKTGKIDHPPTGSKDCADALAGVVYGLTMRREIWGLFKIPLVMIPSGIRLKADTMEQKNEHQLQNQAAQAKSEIAG